LQNQQQMIIYAGPSLSSKALELIDELSLDLRQPVKRGDIRKFLETSTPETIIIADGLFHQVLSVGHEEIMDAIEQDWLVIGLCSMGAIRAYELRNFGMKGIGKVYQRFFEMEDFQDDELALFHEPVFPFTPYTEPLVHYRACVEFLMSEGRLNSLQGEVIVSELKKLYFGDRTVEYFSELLSVYLEDVTAVTGQFERFREKQNDLIDFLLAIKRSRKHVTE